MLEGSVNDPTTVAHPSVEDFSQHLVISGSRNRIVLGELDKTTDFTNESNSLDFGDFGHDAGSSSDAQEGSGQCSHNLGESNGRQSILLSGSRAVLALPAPTSLSPCDIVPIGEERVGYLMFLLLLSASSSPLVFPSSSFNATTGEAYPESWDSC